jgi:hypothetical protein
MDCCDGMTSPSTSSRGAPGLLYATDYRDVDGIIIPTTRRAWQGDDHVPEFLMIAIDMGEITIR